MSLHHINTIFRNPYLYAQAMKIFLSEFNHGCPVQKLFVGIAILEYEEAREKLSNANSRSSFRTLFDTASNEMSGIKLDGNSRLVAFYQRYRLIYGDLKRALLLLLNDGIARFDGSTGMVALLKYDSQDYYDMLVTERLKAYQKAAKSLGKLMLHTSDETLEYYLGAHFA